MDNDVTDEETKQDAGNLVKQDFNQHFNQHNRLDQVSNKPLKMRKQVVSD